MVSIFENIDPSKSIREGVYRWTIWRLQEKLKKSINIHEESYEKKLKMRTVYAGQKQNGQDTSRVVSEMFALDDETNRLIEKKF